MINCELRSGIDQLQFKLIQGGMNNDCELRSGIDQLQCNTSSSSSRMDCELRSGIDQLQSPTSILLFLQGFPRTSYTVKELVLWASCFYRRIPAFAQIVFR